MTEYFMVNLGGATEGIPIDFSGEFLECLMLVVGKLFPALPGKVSKLVVVAVVS